jgi:electron transfer flavoprotein alpha subunit
MAGDIWVMAEQWRGQISEPTCELLALGRELANELHVGLEAVLLGQGVRELAGGLGLADRVLYGDHAALAEPTAESAGPTLTALMKARQPRCLLLSLSNVGADIAGWLPAALGAPFLNSCRDVRVVDGELEARCLLHGGKMDVIARPMAQPAVLGVLPGTRPAEAGRREAAPPVEDVTVAVPETPRVRLKAYLDPEAGDVDITRQDVLIALGRGIANAANVALGEELAAALGGAVCGSRPVIDQGWLPLSRQVGKSGAIVKPRLYLAAGISGAPEHIEGMKHAQLIVAINTDPHAPIFGVAHYGIVADLLEVLPAVTEAVMVKKG